MSRKSQKALAENRWKPGESGNPLGKPKGSKNRTTLIKQAIEGDMVDAVKQDAVAVFQKAVQMALAGNEQMIKLVVDKFVSNARTEDGKSSKNLGGVHITVQAMPPQTEVKTTIESAEDAEIIEEQNNG